MRRCPIRPAAVLLTLGLALTLAAGRAVAGAPAPGDQAISGTLQRVALEGGFWGLRTAAGERYLLLGADAAAARIGDGRRVIVRGRPRPQRASFQMWGTPLQVRSLRPAP